MYIFLNVAIINIYLNHQLEVDTWADVDRNLKFIRISKDSYRYSMLFNFKL